MAERKRKRSISLDADSKESSSGESSASSQRTESKSKDPSFLSMKSDSSMYEPMTFRRSQKTATKSNDPSFLSMKSDSSMYEPMTFRRSQRTATKSNDPSFLSMKSDSSMYEPMTFSAERPKRSELRKAKKLQTDPQEQGNKDEGECVGALWKEKKNIKQDMKKKYTNTFEGVDDKKTSLNSIYTKLFIVAGESSGLHEEQEFRHLHGSLKNEEQDSISLTEIFKPVPGQEKVPRTVVTKGVAGIGKSFAVQKFILDWAEGVANQDIDFVFNFAFKELNLCSNMKSLQQLLTDFHPALRTLNDPEDLDKVGVMVILDGLDESRLPLCFNDDERVFSVSATTSVATLLANLIQGNLLPHAKIWITSRPAAANQVPADYVDMVTEIRGFNDSQKEEYFKRRFLPDVDRAERIYSHIQSSQTLDIMCQIPIFCWISAELFQEIFEEEQAANPQTLTEMMAYFLFSQNKRRCRKYEEGADKTKDPLMSHREFLLKLGKLAFVQLQRNNLIFYEEDLEACGIGITEATIYSGFCTAILREEDVFSQKKIFFFVHLTIQEFFAALYVFDCFTNKNTTDLSYFLGLKQQEYTLLDLLKITVDKVLERKNGHLDFFLRFLLGLTAESNRKVLQGLLTLSDPSQDANKKILIYLKAIHRKTLSPDSCITLFQCMVEMRDYSVKEEIQEYLKLADRSAAELTPMHCSALAFMLQVSKNYLDELNLRRYHASEEGRRRLIPALRSSRKGLLADSKVTEKWVPHLVFVLKFPSSPLRHLDLSNNDLHDSGVCLLSEGVSSKSCRLETLRLSGCLVTEKGCASLVLALKTNPAHLRDLDLSYNNPGESGRKLLSQLPPTLSINTDNCGSQRIKPGYKKYAVVPTLDPNTAHRNLLLKDAKVTWVEKKCPYPDHQDRFDHVSQVLGAEPISGRFYCEIEGVEPCNLGVTYKSIARKGGDNNCQLGHNNKSWSLFCSDKGCNILHNNVKIEVSSHCQRSSRVGIYVDPTAGTLSFYRASSASVTHLHTFEESFKEPLYVCVELFCHSSAMFMSI